MQTNVFYSPRLDEESKLKKEKNSITGRINKIKG